ncbi:cyclic AMP-dependent transcription factor ATF-6 alpha isoform X2 [Phymastichus coffea]|uniref:cyclic AMP-dependent transcription factor ATF-6 alpha isoform X2 n=1 Tax=Phymastichus coffea TaxID=108790 RepID=UPI00273BED44|nr:cyclic AMP-dependent transcription factor ATF-6 alpha isoform X2 [Phymastichus coffea]
MYTVDPNIKDESALPADDFLEALSSDLEIPLLLNGEGSPSCDESPDEIMRTALESQLLEDINFGFMDTDDPRMDFTDFFTIDERSSTIKLEPKSPFVQLPLSPSPSQSDSSSGSEWPSETSSITNSENKFTLETPPISPPRNDSPPTSPQPAQKVPSIIPKVKLLPLGQLNIKDSTMQKFLLSDNPAKRICIQPKLDNSNSKETPRKTIVLSPQDFAALTQRVKQSTTQPLKVQTLPMSKHVKIQNQLNLLPVKQTQTGTNTSIIQNSQVKIINAIPKVQAQIPKASVITVPAVNESPTVVPSVVIQKNNQSGTPVVIKNRVPVGPSIVIQKDNPDCTPIIVKNEFPELINIPNRQESELKALKRQQRMIKNRESACLSRKKKKEYVTSLEIQIADLQKENKKLQAENSELKKRLSTIEETGGKKLSGQHFGVNKKNTAILLAMVFMVSLNVGSLGFNQSREPLGDLQPNVPSLTLPNVRHGRTLLWSTSDESQEDTDRFNDTLPQYHPMCPMHINRTESIRLDYELRRWIGGDPNRENWTKASKTNLKMKSLNELLHLKEESKENLRSASRRTYKRVPIKSNQIKDMPSNINAVQVFSPLLKEHAKLFDALGRKDDTFYVVWFTGDHLLLLASRKNSTARPKMSLVLPAVPVNGSYYSTPPNHVTMMQIDCEVTNTQLLHLQEAIIPKHLRNKDNFEANEAAKIEVLLNSTKSYKPYFLKENNNPNSLENKRPYMAENPNLYDSIKSHSFSEKQLNKIKEFANATEDLKKANNLHEKQLYRQRLRRSAHN